RGQLLVDPGNGFRMRIIGDYDAIDENCCAVVNMQDGLATPAIRALGGQVNVPADRFDGVVYNNFNSTNDIENYGLSGQIDIDLTDSFTLTSITAFRETDSITAQDSDFTSADLIYPNFQDLSIGTLTQELRLTGQIGDRVDLLLGAFYISEDIDQRNELIYGSQFRPYANLLVQQLSAGALSLPALEAAFGAADGTNYAGQFLAAGQGFDERYTLHSEAISLFGQVDFEIVDGLVLTLGGNYTHDSKTFKAAAESSDVFSGIDFNAPQYETFRRMLLVGGGLRQAGGDPNDPAAVLAFASHPATAPDYSGIVANAVANQSIPLASPLAQLRALQFMPPVVDVPMAVEGGRIKDDDFAYTVRLAYDLRDAIDVYARYATGFKASSINLSRDS